MVASFPYYRRAFWNALSHSQACCCSLKSNAHHDSITFKFGTSPTEAFLRSSITSRLGKLYTLKPLKKSRDCSPILRRLSAPSFGTLWSSHHCLLMSFTLHTRCLRSDATLSHRCKDTGNQCLINGACSLTTRRTIPSLLFPSALS